MSQSNFQRCLGEVLRWEGGLVNHPRDPGGITNWGVTRRSLGEYLGRPVTALEVEQLPLQVAEQVYLTLYWSPVLGDDLPAGVDLMVFDAAVNSGVIRSTRWLQAALGVDADGKWGPVTTGAVATLAKRTRDHEAVCRRLAIERLGFLHSLDAARWSTFGRGWERRIKGQLKTALGWLPLREQGLPLREAGSPSPAEPSPSPTNENK